MRNFTEILDLLGQMKTQLRIDDPMNHYDKIIEIENHLFAEQNKQTDLVGYIHKDDLEKLLSDNAGNHLTVGVDTRQAWPTGPGESKPYDWLVAVYTHPAQTVQPPSAQSWELDEESCKFLADMITADPDQITRVGFHLGYAKDDDGKLVHSFSVYETEYPEEGVHPLVETKLKQPVQPVVAQGNQRTIIQDARIESSILSRAMEHPTVLEIMAACAEIIDTESSAVLGADYDGIALRATAKRFLEQAKQIRKSDPEIWENCHVAGLTHTTPAAAINEQMLGALKLAREEMALCGFLTMQLIDEAIEAAEAEKAKGGDE